MELEPTIVSTSVLIFDRASLSGTATRFNTAMSDPLTALAR